MFSKLKKTNGAREWNLGKVGRMVVDEGGEAHRCQITQSLGGQV